MKPAVLRLLGLLLLPLLAGCFTFDTLVSVRRDGSGTVTQTFVLGGSMMEMLRFFSDDEAAFDPCGHEDLEAQAAEMGAGVRLLTATPTAEEGTLGCHAVFAFDDVNRLRLNQNPGGRLEDAGAGGPVAETPQYVTFDFTPGAEARLAILLPQPTDSTRMPAPPPDALTADSSAMGAALEMMRSMLEGGKVRLALTVEGSIVETNAAYRDGDTLTLLAMDMDSLLADEAQLQRLSLSQPQSPEEARLLLKGVPGLRMETAPEVVVRFR